MNISDLRLKAEAGSSAAQAVLGICYLDGIDVEPNPSEAFRLLSIAAGKGLSRAVVNLARMHEEGIGTPRNVAEAIRLYKAVGKVECMASIALGRIYSRGDGVLANPREAVKWYSEALSCEDTLGQELAQEARKYVASFQF